jgi:hypothetical protein
MSMSVRGGELWVVYHGGVGQRSAQGPQLNQPLAQFIESVKPQRPGHCRSHVSKRKKVSYDVSDCRSRCCRCGSGMVLRR